MTRMGRIIRVSGFVIEETDENTYIQEEYIHWIRVYKHEHVPPAVRPVLIYHIQL